MEQPDLGGRGGRFFSFKWRQNNILDLKLFFFFLLFYFILFIYGYAGSSLLCKLFSSYGEQSLFFNCSAQVTHLTAQASPCGGFSCLEAQAQASGIVAHGLSSCGSQAPEHSFS